MNRETNLEAYLKKYNGTYFEIYENIKRAVQKIWQKPRLDWYTDHGPEHSERIIFHLNRLCTGLLRTPPETGIPHYGLEPVEVFLLLASAWLHDIGMQDLSDLKELSVDQMNNEVWDEVRKRHPKRSYEIIMAHAAGSTEADEFWLGIEKEPKIHAPLALICKGHGSDYFEGTVKIFRKRQFDLEGKGTKIRGEMLTALLLIADELDLHLSRAVFKENYPLSKISRLHHYRHHYIGQAEVIAGFGDAPETHRTINITFCFPPVKDSDKEWMGNLEAWVRNKIEKEAKRTAPFLHEGFEGHFLWSEPLIKCDTQEAEDKEKVTMEKNVQYLLAAEFQKVIDWKEVTLQLTNRFKEKEGGVVCLYGNPEQGIGRFISFIECIFYSSIEHSRPEPPMAILNFSGVGFNKYHSIEDVFDGIAEHLGGIENKKGNESIINHLQSEEIFFMIILQHLDSAGQGLIETIMTKIVKRCQLNPKNFLLLITSDKKNSLFNGLKTYNLPHKYEEKDIRDYFIEMGDTEKTAHSKAKACLNFLEGEKPASPNKCEQITKLVDELFTGNMNQMGRSNGKI